ncbi:MAG: PVC-type heme-binding CxxCH protein, partial [Gemmataceae bacterium]
MKAIKVRDGFTVELMAAEPLTQDPVAFAWGPDGKFWIAEMGDYPRGVDDKGKAGGRVRFLEDTDNDGKYDTSTVFLEGLGFPTGVMPWRKGVLITCAPDILYAEDTDGDGKADKKEVLFTGFREGNQQHRVNGLTWGLDNWIYAANGDSGGLITARGKDGKPVNISGRDFRFRPDDLRFDLQAGQTQFGRCRDDWGNWFGGNNSNPLWHYTLEDHYLRRNPHLAAPDGRVQVPVTPGAAAVFPTSRTLARFNSPQAVNHFTSACSPVIYRDDLFGAPFAGNSFVSEPVHNLIHREIVSPKGITFSSKRADDEQQSEFLASSDNWFRPTTIAVGPDGALWVADMYRLVIEHPEWIPKDWQDRLDLRAGHNLGRIYRIYPKDARPRAIPRLDKLDTAGLVAALDSPSGWQRDLAQQLLLGRNDKQAVPLLVKLATESKRPQTRLQALCTLDGLQTLEAASIKRALTDPHPGVRRHAIRLAEGLLKEDATLGTELLKRVDDDDALVRLQLGYTLGSWDDPRAGQALGKLALKDGSNRLFAAALLSSIHGKNLNQVLQAVLKSRERPVALVAQLLRLAGDLKENKALVVLLNDLAKPEAGKYTADQFAIVAGLLDALDLRLLHKKGSPELQQAIARLGDLFEAARRSLVDEKAPEATRLRAAAVVGRGLDKREEDLKLLASLLVPQTPEPLQAACLATLGRAGAPQTPDLLLKSWQGYGPKQRGLVLDALLGRTDWIDDVLAAIEKKQIGAAEIGATHRQRLLEHKSAAIRSRAGKLFAGSIDSNRQKVIDAYQPALELTGEVRRGMQVFAKTCAACHKLGDVGHVVGADLTALGDKSPAGLLV